jgi:hypothetical protein
LVKHQRQKVKPEILRGHKQLQRICFSTKKVIRIHKHLYENCARIYLYISLQPLQPSQVSFKKDNEIL